MKTGGSRLPMSPYGAYLYIDIHRPTQHSSIDGGGDGDGLAIQPACVELFAGTPLLLCLFLSFSVCFIGSEYRVKSNRIGLYDFSL